MHADDLLLLGLKKCVTAFLRTDGSVLWKTELPNSSSGSFIGLTTDAARIFAVCHGAITCLDLFSGQILWADPLRGYGYGIGSLCLPGENTSSPVAAAAQFEVEKRQRSRASAAGAS